jgi:Bacterial PH domain/Short C-terminal domain
MIDNLKKFLNEDQDPKAIEKVANKLNGILMNGEEVEYIAVQKKPAVNISPDCVALTNKRIIFCRPKNLGLSLEFQDYIWKDVADCHLKEEIFGAEFMVKTVKGQVNKIDYLPKTQARKLYTVAQEQEEVQKEIRRQRDLEDKRASAGNVTVTSNVPTNSQPIQQTQQDDPMASLQKLKMLLENGLVTQEEFDTKKADILSRL